ncbi:branched-chain-amino-acid aminotransferase 2, chloroplastic-like isoform X2 [Vicia villosa]|uniref:branched-chain-amino-acid aminotransferase 2, chloroplastic-like isoform X2 n=1 Tax=Vicia villosa TaxID=3911 RepID=UPI00273B49AE|nr:branched-chain-amino-acid aminotransferase 2, chloroplastic-like isoform X2 [Vicia villosa]
MILRTLNFPSLRKFLLQPRYLSSSKPPPVPIPSDEEEYANVDWDSLGFGLTPTDFMYVTKCDAGQSFGDGEIIRYGNIELGPSAGVLNYGQGLFEGTKVYRKENGKLLLFRPEENAVRMNVGAKRMCMASPSIDQFVNALKQTVIANKRWVPPSGKGSLYLRPLLLGSGPVLGVAPAPEYTFLVYASPVRNYFKEGSAPLNLYVEEDFDRASRCGTGNIKTICNYAPVLMAQIRAKIRGFSDVLYLDSDSKKNLEEVSACNIFVAKGKNISTPSINRTILPGITRKSVIEIACDFGYQVEERVVAVEELAEADEVFCTGTAVGVAPVGSVTYKSTRFNYKTGSGSISEELCKIILGIQTGIIEDKKGWIIEFD